MKSRRFILPVDEGEKRRRHGLIAAEASQSLFMGETPRSRDTGSLPAAASGEGWVPAREFAENWGVL
jgi:hypothetical protein